MEEIRKPYPPKHFLRFFRWYCHPRLADHIEGDLIEIYRKRVSKNGKRNADIRFVIDVLKLIRPGIIRRVAGNRNLNQYGMLKSYFKIGWRNLFRNKGYSAINIGGLAMGMAVAVLIGLWIHDELSFNKNHQHYDRIARVMHHASRNNISGTSLHQPFPLGTELTESFKDDFEYVVMSTFTQDHIISNGTRRFNESGYFMQPDAPEMLTLEMLRGTRSGLKELNSIMLSESLAERIFGAEDPINQLVKLDNQRELKVTGVFEDLPKNSDFHDMKFIAPWELYIATNEWISRFLGAWDSFHMQIFVQLSPAAAMEKVSDKIRSVLYDHGPEGDKVFKREVFLHPMSKWHLYEEFRNRFNTGRIEFVWLFGVIGIFILLLACINFMNLSTARSENRAKEVGIRKSIGSARTQLISQFFSESLLVTVFAFVLCLGIVFIALPWFNEISNKQIDIPWRDFYFWGLCFGFTLLTGVIAGSYPALYLSSFNAVKVLKGTFRAGRLASVPRKVLVTLQFTVSVILIIGTIVVYRQIQHTKDRPIGYNRDGLVYVKMNTNEIHNHFEIVRNRLIASKAIQEMAESSTEVTKIGNNIVGIDWPGKDPEFKEQFTVAWITPEYGKTIGWEFLEGRDFSREIVSDLSGLIINKSAADYMGLKSPVGEIVKWDGRSFTILGVVKDVIAGSPYQPVTPAMYMPLTWPGSIVSLKLNPNESTQYAIDKIQSVYKEFAPAIPFEYKFADEEYANKFSSEVRIGQLASVFASLSVLISCLGLFGMASFVAEQRTKEMGIRKIVGASVFNLWKMLSKDFIILVLIACFIAIPIGYYFMDNWLRGYEYHTEISWWIFAVAGVGALVITLLTVSYQAIKAALMNPVKSLRSE